MNEAKRSCQCCQGRRIVPATLSCLTRGLPSRENASALCPDTPPGADAGELQGRVRECSCSGTRALSACVHVLGGPQLTGPPGRLAVQSCIDAPSWPMNVCKHSALHAAG